MADEFTIEKNIPPPSRWRNRFPLDKMEIGDSFDCKDKKTIRLASAAAWVHARKNPPKKFSVRGTRIWRVA
jgi:hypothetical protein